MQDNFIKTYAYSKGVYQANFYDINTRQLLYHDSKLTDANIQSSVNLGELPAGIGNVPQIYIPDSFKLAITMTAGDIDLRQTALQTGNDIAYNGVVDVCEVITATTASLVVSDTPVKAYGAPAGVVVGYVNGSGTPYAIDPTTKTVQNFTATAGTTYSVKYKVSRAANKVLDIKALLAPMICSTELIYPLYAAPTGTSANNGTLYGYIHYIFPRFQFSGEANFAGSQTTAATGGLSGNALAMDDQTANDCAASSLSSMCYVVWEPVDQTSGIEALAVVGGAVSVAVGSTVTIPVKFVMADGALAQPKMSDLTFASAATSTATVAAGVVTGVAAGDTEVTITYTGVTPNLTTFCNVTVT